MTKKVPTEKKPFVKLASGGSIGARIDLYETFDHLMLMEGAYTENYRRFYFSEIKAVVTAKDMGSQIASLLGISVLFIIGLISGAESEFSAEMLPVWGFFFGLSAIVLVRAIIVYRGGGYCRCFLATGVQTTQISPIKTMHKARELTRRIEARAKSQTPVDASEGTPVATTGDIIPAKAEAQTAEQGPVQQTSEVLT